MSADAQSRDSDAEDAELLDLFTRAASDPAAREALVERYRSLAEFLARKFAGRGEANEDLAQVAMIGLLNAIDRFDPGRGVRFSTFAAATIVGELKRHFRDKGWAVRVPRRLQELALGVNRCVPVLTQRLGRAPTVPEIADQLQAGTDEVIEAMEASQSYSIASLDAPMGDTGSTLAETVGTDDPSFAVLEGWASIAPAIEELSERDRRVLYLRFFADMTQSQIAAEVGVSQMHVSRILAHTVERLRRASSA